MNRSKRSVFVVAVFLLGCAVGGASSRYIATASADPPPPGTLRWSYLCFKDDDEDSIQERSRQLGYEGWELASAALAGGADVSSPIWCFKRPR